MRRRRFRFPTSATALVYITHLLANGYTFTVLPTTGWVDVETPFDLAVTDFPDASTLLEGVELKQGPPIQAAILKACMASLEQPS